MRKGEKVWFCDTRRSTPAVVEATIVSVRRTGLVLLSCDSPSDEGRSANILRKSRVLAVADCRRELEAMWRSFALGQGAIIERAKRDAEWAEKRLNEAHENYRKALEALR